MPASCIGLAGAGANRCFCEDSTAGWPLWRLTGGNHKGKIKYQSKPVEALRGTFSDGSSTLPASTTNLRKSSISRTSRTKLMSGIFLFRLEGCFMNIQAELDRLREENARLKNLLLRHGIAWEDRNDSSAQKKASQNPNSPCPSPFSTSQKLPCSAACSQAARMSIPNAGSPRQREHQAMPLPAATSGRRAYALSPKYGAQTARQGS